MRATKRKYLSWSQVNTYRKCPMLYYWVYIERKRIPPPWVFAFGHSVEGGLNYNFSQKIQSRKDLALKKVLDAYDFTWQAETQKEDIDWQGENRGKCKDKGVKLVSLYHKDRSPEVQPVAVQDKIEVHFENVGYYFLAILDLVEEIGSVLDFKTSKKTPNEAVVLRSEQLTAYSLGYRVKYGKPEKYVRLDYMVHTKEPKLVRLTATRQSDEIDAFLETVGSVYQAISKEIFTPCSQDAWWCGLKNCGFFGLCKPKSTVISITKQLKEAEKKNKAEEAKKKKEGKKHAKKKSRS